MTTLTPAQQRQQNNRTVDGKYTTKQHSEADVDLGLGADPDHSHDDGQQEDIQYSFLEQFELLEEEFNTDFDGVPNRFFNADLEDKHLNEFRLLHDAQDNDALKDVVGKHEGGVNPYFRDRELSGRLCHAVSSPADMKIDDDQVEELIKDIDGVTKVWRFDDDQPLLSVFGRSNTKGWLATVTTEDADGNPVERILAVTDQSNNKLRSFHLKQDHNGVRGYQHITHTDIRSLVGAKRIEHLTGMNPVEDKAKSPTTRGGAVTVPHGDYPDAEKFVIATDPRSGREFFAYKPLQPEQTRALKAANRELEAQSMVRTVETLDALQDAQLRGRNFQAQKKYFRDQRGAIATVFDEKKHPDKTRQQMMAETSLTKANGGYFNSIEIDNDVDPEQYQDFTNAVHETMAKIGDVGELNAKIRYTGKHRAKGLYSPTHKTLVVDVRTSEAFIHEMGHHLDLTVKNNASLSRDFQDISRQYSSALKEPDAKRRGYLNTPTEQFARGFEIYAHEKLGVNNRLVKPENFEGNDYAPFRESPELKAKAFAFFDRVLDK